MGRKYIELKLKVEAEVTIGTYEDMEHTIEHFNEELADHIDGGYHRPWCGVVLENLRCTSVEEICEE
jgi:hypothetical protein